jgi:histidinol-phosphate phosphatase family protein
VDRRATDWEHNVAALEGARWITADLAVRRDALHAVGGFDERFPRAYREDADLGLRLTAAGCDIDGGARRVTHPAGAASPWISVRKQVGNADDALMRRLHGRGWRESCGAPRGALPTHAATVACGIVAATAAAPRTAASRAISAAATLGWTALTARFAWRRIAPGPRTPSEIATMLATSVAIPPAAVAHRLAGEWRARRIVPRTADRPDLAVAPAAVLLDRDGTLVVDVPYNGDPDKVEPMPGAREALDRLRAAGIPLAVVSNQSGVARGLLDLDDVAAVNRRVEELLGPFDTSIVCPHDPADRCACRKPRPGMLLEAAWRLGVDPTRCAMIGDIASDVRAGLAAGARPVLVPTAATRPEEVHAAPEVATDLRAAVDLLLAVQASPETTPVAVAL